MLWTDFESEGFGSKIYKYNFLRSKTSIWIDNEKTALRELRCKSVMKIIVFALYTHSLLLGKLNKTRKSSYLMHLILENQTNYAST